MNFAIKFSCHITILNVLNQSEYGIHSSVASAITVLFSLHKYSNKLLQQQLTMAANCSQ